MKKELNPITESVKKAITWNHEGKMSGMVSLSTSPLKNEYCIRRYQNKDAICSHCFSMALQKMRKQLADKLMRNTELLTGSVISVEDMPVINSAYFRLESFGDLNNEVQVINYFNLCRKNKNTTFALWTKNPFIIRKAIANGHRKPSNLIIVYSSPCMNKQVNVEVLKTVYPFIDKVFTVYDKEHAENVNINCGANHCLSCLKCYKKRTATIINEKLK